MSEESDLEKTEPATPRRLEKAREEGQVARSRELNTFLLLAAGVATLWLLGERMFRSLTGVFHTGVWFDRAVANDTQVMLTVAANSAFQALLTLRLVSYSMRSAMSLYSISSPLKRSIVNL